MARTKAQKPIKPTKPITPADRARGERIKALRTGFEESQAAFGERFDVEQATVSRWEEGRSVKRSLWDRLAQTAGRPTLDFIFGQQVEVPLLSWVAAGELRDTGDIPHSADADWVPVAALPDGEWFALRVEGDSMDLIAPHGSIIFINRADRNLVSEGFYVFQGGDGATFKQYMSDPPRLEPFSSNKTHRTTYPKKELYTIGRVRRVITDLL